MKAAIPNDDDGVALRRKLKRRRAIRKRKAKLERQERRERKEKEWRERMASKAISELMRKRQERKESKAKLEVQVRKVPTQLEIEEMQRETAWECAEAALASYNRIQTQQHFELVVVLNFEERYCAGQLPPDGRYKWSFWRHLNFKAKPTTGVDAPKIFFAELANKSVTACSVISPTEETTITGCGFCPAEGKMQHPAHGLCAGNYVPPDHDPDLWEKFRAACKACGLDRKRKGSP